MKKWIVVLFVMLFLLVMVVGVNVYLDKVNNDLMD